MARVPVIIDCDPGIDDALALIYLAALHRNREIEIVGVTTTAGNVSIDATARNAAWVLYMCGLEHIPVAAGAPAPLEAELVTTPETHGEHGLGYLPAPDRPYSTDWQAVWKAAAERQAHLLITGPLTNAALYAATDSLAAFRDITVMGGSVNYQGNTTPTAEWNFWVDPHAARDFFAHLSAHELKATLCSLGVTEQFSIGPVKMDKLIKELGAHSIAKYIPELMRFYFEFHEAQGEGYKAHIHDLLTCMIAFGKVPCDKQDTYVTVEAESELLRGTSVADLRNHWGKAPNTRLVTAASISSAHKEFLRAADMLTD
ncbi:nucleoside hydrolase [Corynebacterium phocae]|uniref:Nucleoside hydrolase n=1 Tax=Corynebacterium phocae TaxID=161895 RepID=A0A1L7D301_9CORY|nr:nucleoside hydrolase [Corynebacterium phocae]APT92504.1 nucleoside hydrolase [Corynebacterium phocae]KAA8725108.1 nucleoside hydrolase [Corynebacterium phocae]